MSGIKLCLIKNLNLLALSLWAAAASAEDWPQWGGPRRDHVSREKGLLQDWPANGPKQVWRAEDTGLGYSGLAVAGGKLFLMGGREKNEYLIAKDAQTGKDLWATEIGAVFRNDPWGDGPRGTPSVSDDKVFAMGGQGTLIAANMSDGKVLWKKTMQELGGQTPGWGFTESVLAEEGKVYCTPGGGKGAVAALDQKTGQVLWQSKDFKDEAQYASVFPADINGTRQLVQLTMASLVGISAKDGAVLWRSPWPGRTAVIPSPIVRGNLVYITSGYGVGCKLVEVGPNNAPKTVYENKVMKNHHGGVVAVGDHVYGYSDGPGWVCQYLKTGEEIWASKKLGKGSVVCADGRLYCLEEDTGTVALVEASPKGWIEHGRFKLDRKSSMRSPNGKVWMHPVVANGKLYLRDQEFLFCYDVAAK